MKRQVTAALSALLIAAGAFAVSAPASADGSCPSGATCLWQHASYGGGKITFFHYIPNLALWNFDNGVKANDDTSSVWTRGNYEFAYLFQHADAKGRGVKVEQGGWYDDLNSEWFNDYTSSAYFSGYQSCK